MKTDMHKLARDLHALADALNQLPDTGEWYAPRFTMQSNEPGDNDPLWKLLNQDTHTRVVAPDHFGDTILSTSDPDHPLELRISTRISKPTERERLLARLAELDGQVA